MRWGQLNSLGNGVAGVAGIHSLRGAGDQAVVTEEDLASLVEIVAFVLNLPVLSFLLCVDCSHLRQFDSSFLLKAQFCASAGLWCLGEARQPQTVMNTKDLEGYKQESIRLTLTSKTCRSTKLCLRKERWIRTALIESSQHTKGKIRRVD